MTLALTYVLPQSPVMRLVVYFRVIEVIKTKVLSGQAEELERIRLDQNQLILIYRLRNYTVTTQYLQEVQNRRRVVYYAILLLLILGELLGEINYIIIIFLEYDNSQLMKCWHYWIKTLLYSECLEILSSNGNQ